MAKAILKELEDAEAQWRRSSPEWNAKLSQWTNWMKRKHRRQQAEERAQKQTRKNNRDEDGPSDPAGVDPEDAKWASFDPVDPLPDFTFANVTKYQKSELAEDIADLKWTSTPPWVIRALWRGVAVHHAGMNKGYRTTVER